MTPREPIDSLIDNAAAQLTSAMPSDALRANVMSRLRAERFAGPARPGVWRYVFAGGAVVTIALVAFVSWQRGSAIPNRTIPTPTLINPAVINGSPIAAANPTGGDWRTSPSMSMARTDAAHDGGQSALALLTNADQESGMTVAALERPELMTPVKPLFEGAPMKAIDIEPIRMAPLVVPAIDDDNQ